MKTYVIILSHAVTASLHATTLECIQSIKKTSFADILVVEGNPNTIYNKNTAETLHTRPGEFDFVREVNRAVWYLINSRNVQRFDRIVIAHNDVIFMGGWAQKIDEGGHLSSFHEIGNDLQNDLKPVEVGSIYARHFLPSCFSFTVESFVVLGGFTEGAPFNVAALSIMNDFKEIHVIPCVVNDAYVTHKKGLTYSAMVAGKIKRTFAI